MTKVWYKYMYKRPMRSRLRCIYVVSPEADVADLVDLHLILNVHHDSRTLREGERIVHRLLVLGGEWPFSQGCFFVC